MTQVFVSTSNNGDPVTQLILGEKPVVQVCCCCSLPIMLSDVGWNIVLVVVAVTLLVCVMVNIAMKGQMMHLDDSFVKEVSIKNAFCFISCHFVCVGGFFRGFCLFAVNISPFFMRFFVYVCLLFVSFDFADFFKVNLLIVCILSNSEVACLILLRYAFSKTFASPIRGQGILFQFYFQSIFLHYHCIMAGSFV